MGFANHGYEFVAPLDSRGISTPTSGRSTGSTAGCVGFGAAPTKKSGDSRTSRAGRSTRWVFDYDPDTTDDDEAGYRFGVHAFAPGEYVSIRSYEGGSHTFKVVSVEPAD